MDQSDLVLHRRGVPYVRLSFCNSNREEWALKVRELRTVTTYQILTRQGEETNEFVVATKNEVIERPAGMSKKYAWMEEVAKA